MAKRAARSAAALVAAVSVLLLVSTPPAGAANLQSQSFAGYLGGTNTGFTTSTVRVTVPTFTCPPSGNLTTRIFVRWTGSSTAGGTSASLDVFVNCSDGAATYSANINEEDPNGAGHRALHVSPGDRLSATLQYVSESGIIKMTARDLSTGERVTEVGTAEAVTWSGVVYEFAPQGAATPLPSFPDVVFSGLTFDGVEAGTALAFLTGYNLFSGTHKLVHTTPFNPAGLAFRFKFVASA